MAEIELSTKREVSVVGTHGATAEKAVAVASSAANAFGNTKLGKTAKSTQQAVKVAKDLGTQYYLVYLAWLATACLTLLVPNQLVSYSSDA